MKVQLHRKMAVSITNYDLEKELLDASTDEEAEILYLINYYMLKPEEVAGMTAKEIDEKYNEREFTSENVYWTSWND